MMPMLLHRLIHTTVPLVEGYYCIQCRAYIKRRK